MFQTIISNTLLEPAPFLWLKTAGTWCVCSVCTVMLRHTACQSGAKWFGRFRKATDGVNAQNKHSSQYVPITILAGLLDYKLTSRNNCIHTTTISPLCWVCLRSKCWWAVHPLGKNKNKTKHRMVSKLSCSMHLSFLHNWCNSRDQIKVCLLLAF